MTNSESRTPTEAVYAKGKLFELVHITQPDGRIFEVARRAPGVRLIIPNFNDSKILLSREFRQELNSWDYRLPGGKVFDSLDEYEQYRKTGARIVDAVLAKGRAEGCEEVGLELDELTLYRKSTLGATVEWDLFVLVAGAYHDSESGQQLEVGEQIEADNWVSFSEAEQMIIEGKMKEERIALVLLQWLNEQKGQNEV